VKLIDLTGETFGRLQVIERAPSRGKRTYWKCVCKCGNECEVEAYNLTSGHTRSCGCYKEEVTYSNKLKHGMTGTRIFNIWDSMIRRCENPSRESYKYYGGRGITVCEEWHDFENFYRWSTENGYEDYLTIERKNPDWNYCPENCRWASWEEQNVNKRNNKFLNIAGVKMTITQAARIYGISTKTLYQRLKKGYSIEKALGVKPWVPVTLEEIIGGAQ
jgi:hypothetical protein